MLPRQGQQQGVRQQQAKGQQQQQQQQQQQSGPLPAGPAPGMVPPPSVLPPGWRGPHQQHQQQQHQHGQAAEHALSSADSIVGAPPTFYGAGPPVQWGGGFAPMPIGAPAKGPEPLVPWRPEAPLPAMVLPSVPGQAPPAAAGPDAGKAGAQMVPQLTPAMLASLQLAQQAMPNHSQAFPMPMNKTQRPVMKEMVVTPMAPGAERQA
jgi:hypothetical protein